MRSPDRENESDTSIMTRIIHAMPHKMIICHLLSICGIVVFITGCGTGGTSSTLTPPAVSKLLATVYLSPTPNADQLAATRAASSPTPLPATPTADPSPTAYIGQFIGEPPRNPGFAVINAPIFADDDDAVVSAPTADAAVCGIPIEAAFVGVWQSNATVRQRIGCPIQIGFGIFGDSQIFETGVMYHQPEINAVWAIIPQNPQGAYYYLENPAPRPIERVTIPPRLLAPEGIFADMWLSVPDLRDEMGFAQTEPQQAALSIQRFENGTFLADTTAEQVFALIVDGTAYGPYLAPEDARPGNLQPVTTATTGTPSPLPPDAP